MSPRDWLLLYLALKGAPAGLDPVKVQKGMFLFAMEVDVPQDEKYDFRPYNYGPMSPQIYSDLESLEAEGYIVSEQVQGYSWKHYRPTEGGGIELARTLRDAADPVAVRKLFEIKADVAQKSFNALLRDVYERYPDYAARSVFSRA